MNSAQRLALRRWFSAIVVSASVLCGCVSARHGAWTSDDLVGRRLELVDSRQVETMTFAPEGHVALSIGQKGGWLTGPVFHWAVRDGRLQIVDDDGRLHEELTLISQENSRVVARRRSGKVVTYKRY